MHPTEILKQWIEEEKNKGADLAQHAVLSTTGDNGNPHARVVAIKEINNDSILFFTQKCTRKVRELEKNSAASLTFWLERHAREVIVEGEASFLSPEKNEVYWRDYPKWAQARFCSYAPTSSLPIKSKDELAIKLREVEQKHESESIPLSPDYCGVSIKPSRLVFYSYRLDELSDVTEYKVDGKKFEAQILSP